MTDAVVIGAGQNGLVAANILADQGWAVTVLEAQPYPGGAVRSAELFRPGCTHDLFSAFYPLAAASPALANLDLETWGQRWSRAPLVLANPLADGSCPVLSTDPEETAASAEELGTGDGDRWLQMWADWQRLGPDLVQAFLGPFPPLAATARLAAGLRAELLEFGRFALLPARRMAAEAFRGPGPGLLIAGNAGHSSLAPEAVLSGFYGWFMTMLGQEHGFPVPTGGSSELINALIRRLAARGGTVECSQRVTRIAVEGGRAVGVETAGGGSLRAQRAVLADVGAPALYLELLSPASLPSRVFDQLCRFEYDPGTFKVDWLLDGPIPWTAEPARRAGTVHVADGLDHFTDVAAAIHTGRVPERPHLVVGQMTTTDPTRSPPGTETAWAYCHVPNTAGDGSSWSAAERDAHVARIERVMDARAPGFSARIVGRHVLTPPNLERLNANLVGGAINGGTAELYQQLVFRPLPGLARARTPVTGLYLASASAHPGGGVHGGAGAGAARAALQDDRYRFLPAVRAGLHRRRRTRQPAEVAAGD